MEKHKPLLFSGSSNRALAEMVARRLDAAVGQCLLTTFSDGEIRFQSEENVRGRDVFVFQSMTRDINHHIMELLLMADALKRASASRITAVVPYYAYARQDRKDRPRVPISAKLLADLLETAGYTRVLTMDLHANQIQGFFSVPVDNLMALPIFVDYFKRKALKDVVVVSPDAGGVERARLFARQLKAGLAIADKRREKANVAEIMHIIGDVENKVCVIVDDIVDTAGTLVETIKALKKNGACEVYAVCTHGIFSGKALERLSGAPLERIYTTDTVPVRPEVAAHERIEVLSVSALFADAIDSIHEETSVSKLFIKQD